MTDGAEKRARRPQRSRSSALRISSWILPTIHSWISRFSRIHAKRSVGSSSASAESAEASAVISAGFSGSAFTVSSGTASVRSARGSAPRPRTSPARTSLRPNSTAMSPASAFGTSACFRPSGLRMPATFSSAPHRGR